MCTFIDKTRASIAGVTLIEFALCVLVLLGIIGFLVEYTVIAFQHATIRYAATKTVRELTTNVQSFRTEQALVAAAKDRAKSILTNSFGLDQTNASFDAYVISPEEQPSSGSGRYSLLLSIKRPATCFFCIFLSQGLVHSATHHMIIGDKCFSG